MNTYAYPAPVHKACAKPGNGGRYAFENPALVRRKGLRPFWTATDGRMASVVPCKDSAPCADDAPDAIVPVALANAADKLKFPVVSLDNQAASVPAKTGELRANLAEGSFPPVLDVLPKLDDGVQVIGINAKLLASLAASMGAEAVVLLVGKGNRGIGVLPTGEGAAEDAFGVIMPIKSPDDALETWRKRTAMK